VLTQPDAIIITIDTVIQPYCGDTADGTIRVVITNGVGTPSFSWKRNDEDLIGENSNVLENASAGQYLVTVTDENLCVESLTIEVSGANDLCIVIPNAFSPNADGINDEWHIERMDLYPEAEIFILNRWGQLLWKSDRGYTILWDGRSKGKLLPMGSYHYSIDLHNGTKPVVGHVTIVK